MVALSYSCPDEDWGYNSTGERRTVSTCMDNGEWSVDEVEECVCE